jgi:hypothetical protein
MLPTIIHKQPKDIISKEKENDIIDFKNLSQFQLKQSKDSLEQDKSKNISESISIFNSQENKYLSFIRTPQPF